MTVRREIARNTFLVKRISHATRQTHSFRPALHASRTTTNEKRRSAGPAIATEDIVKDPS
ncbi:MAG: hypothetical protein KGO23_04810 [Nitrospirota bacterium]|nr:hypothetical protein [Nitrospirota bacterium]